MGRRAHTTAVAVTAIALGCLIPLALAELVLQFAPVMSGLYATRVDAAQPLARLEPDRDFTYSLGSTFDVVVRGRINNAGWVNDQDYDSTATSPLLAVIGDSYVEALMVPYAETVHGRLAAAARGRGRVYSFGSSGAPLSHYLAIADHVRQAYRPAGAVFVIIANDFDESLLRRKRAPGIHGFAEDSAGGLVLERTDYHPSRARRLLRRSALVRYLTGNVQLPALIAGFRARTRPSADEFAGNVLAQADSARLADSRRAVDAFIAQLPARSGLAPSRVAFVVDGIRPQLYDAKAHAAADSTYFGLMRAYFMAAATKAGYEVADMQPRFIAHHARAGKLFELPNDGHWNGLGHQLAADAVRQTRVFTTIFGPAGSPSAGPAVTTLR